MYPDSKGIHFCRDVRTVSENVCGLLENYFDFLSCTTPLTYTKGVASFLRLPLGSDDMQRKGVEENALRCIGNTVQGGLIEGVQYSLSAALVLWLEYASAHPSYLRLCFLGSSFAKPDLLKMDFQAKSFRHLIERNIDDIKIRVTFLKDQVAGHSYVAKHTSAFRVKYTSNRLRDSLLALCTLEESRLLERQEDDEEEQTYFETLDADTESDTGKSGMRVLTERELIIRFASLMALLANEDRIPRKVSGHQSVLYDGRRWSLMLNAERLLRGRRYVFLLFLKRNEGSFHLQRVEAFARLIPEFLEKNQNGVCAISQRLLGMITKACPSSFTMDITLLLAAAFLLSPTAMLSAASALLTPVLTRMNTLTSKSMLSTKRSLKLIRCRNREEGTVIAALLRATYSRQSYLRDDGLVSVAMVAGVRRSFVTKGQFSAFHFDDQRRLLATMIEGSLPESTIVVMELDHPNCDLILMDPLFGKWLCLSSNSIYSQRLSNCAIAIMGNSSAHSLRQIRVSSWVSGIDSNLPV